MVRLGDVCEISSSKANLTDDKIWLLNLDMVEQQTGKIISYYYVNKNELNGSITQFDTENILYSKLRPNLNKVVVPDRNGFSTSELLPLKPNSKILCREYLSLYLRSDSFVSWAISKTAGAKMPRLGTKALLDKEIPLPPLDEQRRIAATLDKVTDLISKRRQQLDKLDELVKARFVEMFGDPVSNTLELPLLPLSQLGEFGRGVSKHRPRNAPELLGGKYPLIQTGEVANAGLYITSYENTYSEVGFKQSKMWKAGTLCITIAANIAKTAILSFDACFPDSIVGFIANEKTNNIFIHYWFSFFQQILEAQAPESAQKNINLKMLSELNVIVPAVELQNQFAEFVEQTEKVKTTISRSLEKLETLKKALMQEYFG